MSIENIARDLTVVKNELDNLETRYNTLRNSMYNSLTNLGLEEFNGEEYTFRKTNESTYLTISKESFHNALNSVNLTDEQKREIKNIAFDTYTRDSGLRITKK